MIVLPIILTHPINLNANYSRKLDRQHSFIFRPNYSRNKKSFGITIEENVGMGFSGPSRDI